MPNQRGDAYKKPYQLQKAAALRAQIDDEKRKEEENRHTKAMQRACKAIDENRRRGHVRVNALPDSAVKELEEAGYKVVFHKGAQHPGGINEHEIKW